VITIRPAESSDARSLFDWRNDPLTRAASAGTAEVAWDEHEAWLTRVLSSGRQRIYIAMQDDGAPVGMVRFDGRDDGSAEVSINLDPARRGRGLGLAVLQAAIDAFDGERDVPAVLHAVIRPANAASIRLFEAVGFVAERDVEELRHFRRSATR
jgi:RimJ/RimL family protein N-acetyltransferase